jgi:hypothetical protein
MILHNIGAIKRIEDLLPESTHALPGYRLPALIAAS